MGLVTQVNEWTNPQTGRKQWYVDIDGIPHVCYSETAATLVAGQPLPDGWTAEPAKQEGWKPRLVAPGRTGGSGGGGGFAGRASWRNTEDGERYVETCMNRRTALMQAVQCVESHNLAEILASAEVFFGWLQKGPAGENGAGVFVADTSNEAAAAARPASSGPGAIPVHTTGTVSQGGESWTAPTPTTPAPQAQLA